MSRYSILTSMLVALANLHNTPTIKAAPLPATDLIITASSSDLHLWTSTIYLTNTQTDQLSLTLTPTIIDGNDYTYPITFTQPQPQPTDSDPDLFTFSGHPPQDTAVTDTIVFDFRPMPTPTSTEGDSGNGMMNAENVKDVKTFQNGVPDVQTVKGSLVSGSIVRTP